MVFIYLDSNHSLRYIDKYKDTHLVELDELLKDATDNSQIFGQLLMSLKERLINWVDIYSRRR